MLYWIIEAVVSITDRHMIQIRRYFPTILFMINIIDEKFPMIDVLWEKNTCAHSIHHNNRILW